VTKRSWKSHTRKLMMKRSPLSGIKPRTVVDLQIRQDGQYQGTIIQISNHKLQRTSRILRYYITPRIPIIRLTDLFAHRSQIPTLHPQRFICCLFCDSEAARNGSRTFKQRFLLLPASPESNLPSQSLKTALTVSPCSAMYRCVTC
jgi:hypothetical protein